MSREKNIRKENNDRKEKSSRRENQDRAVKDLRKLRRSELLELLVVQSEEIDRLRMELAKAQEQLHSRAVAVRESGSLADAAVKLSGVMQAAEEAAQIYLDNIKRMEAEKRAESSLSRQAENRRD